MGHLSVEIVDITHPFSLKEKKIEVKAIKGNLRCPVFYFG